uniref:Solute carrier family 2 member 11 n=1 Tax=Strigops habroptila TaxID=2489341 RepID=A0A672URS1_STRHB
MQGSHPFSTHLFQLQSKILILTICTAGIGGTFQYGYNLSIINAPASYIQMLMNKTWLRCRGVPLERNVLLLWSFTVSAYPLGGLIGAVTAGQMAIMLGRKMSLLLNNVFVITAAVLSGFTEVSFCLPCPGVSMNIQHMYLAESAPKQLRGAVALTSASFTALGLVLGQVVGLRELLGGEESWPFLLASNVVPALIQLTALPWLPESPRYLLIDRGDKESCISGEFRVTVSLSLNYAGQRPLLLGEYIFMAGWAIIFMVALSQQISWMPYLSMACIFDYILSFGTRPAGVTGVLPIEVFDRMSWPAAYMTCGSPLWFNLFLVGTAFPFFVKSLAHFCYAPLLVVCICIALYVEFFLPETKGKSFLEILEEFKKWNFKAQTHEGFYKGPEEIKSTVL